MSQNLYEKGCQLPSAGLILFLSLFANPTGFDVPLRGGILGFFVGGDLEETISPKAVWEAVLGDLQIQVNKANYETWLKKTYGLRFENGEFIVGVPSAFVAEYLDKNQRSLVEKALGAVIRKDVEVTFQVGEFQGQLSSRAVRGKSNVQQTSLPLFNPRYTFDSFVTGQSNQFAYAAAMTVANNPGQSYNPLFVYGGAGLGKTHLLQAIGHAAVANNLKVVCVSAEQYANEFVTAIRERHTHELQNKYRSVDMLLLDDVQFFSGKQKIGENFFHTFDQLHNASRQMVITSDRPPKAIPLLPERLSSRLEGGLITEVRAPDYETRLAILQDKSKQDGVELADDVLEFLAAQVRQNIRVLEGSLNRIVAYAKLVRASVTPQLAAQAIRDIAEQVRAPLALTSGNIIDAVARGFQLDPSDLIGKKRDKETTTARRVAMYLLRKHTGFSLNQVGRELGGRDAAAVTNSCRKVAADIETDPFLRRKIIDIQQGLVPE